MIRAGAAAGAVGITGEALALLTGAYQSVDDSWGVIGEAARELLAVHLRSCQGRLLAHERCGGLGSDATATSTSRQGLMRRVTGSYATPAIILRNLCL